MFTVAFAFFTLRVTSRLLQPLLLPQQRLVPKMGWRRPKNPILKIFNWKSTDNYIFAIFKILLGRELWASTAAAAAAYSPLDGMHMAYKLVLLCI